MGAYVYCHKCDTPHGPPSIAQCINEEYRCSSCGEELLVDYKFCLINHIEEMQAMIEALHGKLLPPPDDPNNGL